MPTLSILTPTWNRAGLLERVWRGLTAQTSGDFEWIVADDGSSDDTQAVIAAFASRSSFPVLYLRADAHVGKARMDNEAIARARGELAVWCDSDDMLLPHAVERLLAAWASIPAAEKDAYVGITAFAAADTGVLVDPFAGEVPRDLSWNELAGRYRGASDMVYAARIDALRAHPFPEVDLVVPESAVWNQIGHRKARVVPEVLKRVEYRAPHAISFSGTMSYNRGRAHALAITERALGRGRGGRRATSRRIRTFLRYCRHGEISIGEARALWGDNSSAFCFWLALPAATAMALIDAARGKVVKTHREFAANRASRIEARWLGAHAG